MGEAGRQARRQAPRTLTPASALPPLPCGFPASNPDLSLGEAGSESPGLSHPSPPCPSPPQRVPSLLLSACPIPSQPSLPNCPPSFIPFLSSFFCVLIILFIFFSSFISSPCFSLLYFSCLSSIRLLSPSSFFPFSFISFLFLFLLMSVVQGFVFFFPCPLFPLLFIFLSLVLPPLLIGSRPQTVTLTPITTFT